MPLVLSSCVWLLAAPEGGANPIVSVLVGALVTAALVALYFEMKRGK